MKRLARAPYLILKSSFLGYDFDMRIFFKRISWVGGLICLGLVLLANIEAAMYNEGNGPLMTVLYPIAAFLVVFLLIRILGWCFSVFPSNKDDAQIKDLERKVKIKELEKKLKD